MDVSGKTRRQEIATWRQALSKPLGDLMERNLREVFGQRDSDRRKVAISELYTEDCTFFEAEEQIIGRDAINERSSAFFRTFQDSCLVL
jgi:hypothetical protein